MPGRLRANGISGCLFFLTRTQCGQRIFGRKSKTLENISLNAAPQAVCLIRGQGQSPALEGFGQAKLRATSPRVEVDALARAAALNRFCVRAGRFVRHC